MKSIVGHVSFDGLFLAISTGAPVGIVRVEVPQRPPSEPKKTKRRSVERKIK